ncbi:4a-hydroxytetrahydrobiopterin dehydratase [Nitrosomonas sp.]|uniref:4a-hydroxytetrahydrobiopterin dehydratase n=1 Tax=Nitrosomonas sp. TaxID=42353 RepID=UPI002730B98A|nr:4a-hydroxytetrahydrobiopterin dehydratase [Nitrosomonas sp.]MDP1787413.1 4a-hydroxytetrahydrobiopterin dehydratase [Nitrosomonas sp.]
MNNTVCDLTSKQCKPCEGGVPPLSATEISAFLQQIEGWQLQDKQISKTYAFKNYYQTMAFVNLIRKILQPNPIFSINKAHTDPNKPIKEKLPWP